MLLTACRKAEVIEGQWDEVNLEGAQWEIPAERMKAKRAHWIPLSTQAVALLTRLRELVPANREHLFPNRVDPRRPMANRSLNALMERLGFSGEGTPHGMRASFSTHFNSLGGNIDVIEHCLAHVPANAVRAAYNRHAYQDERRAMLQQWANRLDQLRRECVPTEHECGSAAPLNPTNTTESKPRHTRTRSERAVARPNAKAVPLPATVVA